MAAQTPVDRQTNPGNISYQFLRKTVGWIGIWLPIVLWLSNNIIFGDKIQNSVSAYYYTEMRNIFVGALCIVGVFLLCDKSDGDGTRFYKNWYFYAGILALLVPLFPTAREVPDPLPPGILPLSGQETIVGRLHGGSAIALFVLLGFISIFIFTRHDRNWSRSRNRPDYNSDDVTGKFADEKERIWFLKWKRIGFIYIFTGVVITLVVGIFNGIYATVVFFVLSSAYYLVTCFKINKGRSGKWKRNLTLYIPSGLFIWYCVLAIVLFFPLHKFPKILGFPPGFFFESGALFWFGVCWLSKGMDFHQYKIFGVKLFPYFDD